MTQRPIDQIGWPSLRDHPRFREAVEHNASGILAQRDQLNPGVRWLTNDLGRTLTLTRALIGEAREGRFTVADLLAKSRRTGTVSDGRVLQVLRCAEAAGLVAVGPHTAARRRRQISILPRMRELWRARAAVEIGAACLVAPEVRPALALLARDDGFVAFLSRLNAFDGMAPQVRGPRNHSVRLFLEREAGLAILYDLMLRQPPQRSRLLEWAPLSRARLAERLKVSRTHVRRVIAAAEAAGHLSLPASDRVVFSPAMSEECERHFALTFHVISVCAQAAMDETASSHSSRARGARVT